MLTRGEASCELLDGADEVRDEFRHIDALIHRLSLVIYRILLPKDGARDMLTKFVSKKALRARVVSPSICYRPKGCYTGQAFFWNRRANVVF